MKIESSAVTKFKLSDLDRLDPVTVIFEPTAPQKGRVLIECSNEAWACGLEFKPNKSLIEFFNTCPAESIAEIMSRSPKLGIDYDSINTWLIEHIKPSVRELLIDRRTKAVTKEEARAHYVGAQVLLDHLAEYKFEGLVDLWSNYELFDIYVGDEWWKRLPTSIDHEYEWLVQIIETVQEGLRQYQDQDKTATANTELASI